MDFANLPHQIQDILFSEQSAEINGKIIKEFNLSDEAKNKFFTILRQITLKEKSTDQLLTDLTGVGLSKEKTKQLAVRIIGWCLLPLSNFLGGDLVKQLQDLEGDIADYQSQLKQGQELKTQNAKRKTQNKEDNEAQSEKRKAQNNPPPPKATEGSANAILKPRQKMANATAGETISVEDLTKEVIDQVEK